MIQFRLARLSDCEQLAGVHQACAKQQPESFLDQLGISFLEQFYWVMLRDPQSLILCAVDENAPDRILGFASGTLSAADFDQSLCRHRFRLAWAACRGLLRRPNLVPRVLLRYRAVSRAEMKEEYAFGEGARSIYWAVLPEARKGAVAITLMRHWLSEARARGAQEIGTEVNCANQAVALAHRMLGARVVREATTPDGLRRMFMMYPAPDNGESGTPNPPASP